MLHKRFTMTAAAQDPPERQTSSTPLLADSNGIDGDERARGPILPLEETSLTLMQSDISNDNDDSTRRLHYRRILSLLASPVTDDRGHWTAVLGGFSTLVVAGTILGLSMPKNPVFSQAYRTLSSCLGYTYFLSWSVSFYPQILQNFRRKTTVGLSADFCGLNVLGFLCYAAYNMAMYYSPEIHRLYRERHGAHAEIAVESNDVAFSLHAVILASFTLGQIIYYDGGRSQQVSRSVAGVMIFIVVTASAAGLAIATHAAPSSINWLDYLYLLSCFKILITLIKYVPQVVLNYQRKSTAGFSVWQILLDFSGGALSDLQLVLDCLNLQDWSGITGNMAKFFLGFVSIVFDFIILLQHYFWFPASSAPSGLVAEESIEDQDDASDKRDEEQETVPLV